MKFSSLQNLDLTKVSGIPEGKTFGDILEEECNTFLKSYKGLQYLLLKFPNLSVAEAIIEFKSNYFRVNTIC